MASDWVASFCFRKSYAAKVPSSLAANKELFQMSNASSNSVTCFQNHWQAKTDLLCLLARWKLQFAVSIGGNPRALSAKEIGRFAGTTFEFLGIYLTALGSGCEIIFPACDWCQDREGIWSTCMTFLYAAQFFASLSVEHTNSSVEAKILPYNKYIKRYRYNNMIK